MRWMGLLAVVAAVLGEARAATFTVVNTHVDDVGSLAQAITDANATTGLDTIVFAIADPGVPRITVGVVPDVTDPVTIDGTTQAGGLVELTAATAGAGSGLRILGGGSTVRGLVINRWSHGIELRALGGNVVEGNLIGTDALGTHSQPNVDGVLIDGSPNNRIGGTTPTARNLISGNTSTGIRVQGVGATDNAIEGNRIGTDVSGIEAHRNPTGIGILDGAGGTRVGGTLPGAGNLISGNGTGIRLTAGAEDSSIEGNLIGTDAGGSARLGNVSEGVFISGAKRTRIGGPTPEARNVISANGNGVEIEGNLTEDTLVEGNYIGVDPGGTLDLGNTIGVALTGSTRTRLTGNTIAGNQNGINVLMTNAEADLRIEGNRVGTDPTGTAAIGNHRGILLTSGTAITIGGSEPAAGNVISGNADLGIFTSDVTTGVVIERNRIGTAADGVTALANGGDGVRIAGSGNAIHANTIAFNGARGVALASGVGNAVRENAIFANGGLGIDLGIVGVTPNDATDGDNGANGLQNFPVLDRPLIGGSTVGGTLRSKGGTDFTIEVFANLACDATTHGEGRELLGTATATTDGSGLASFTATVARTLSTEVLTATATDPDGNTSEFSACVIPAEFVTTTTLDATTTSVTTTSTTTTTSDTTAEGSTSSTSSTSSSTTLGSESTSSTASTSSSSSTSSSTTTPDTTPGSSSTSSTTSSTSVTSSTVGTSPSTSLPLQIGCAIVPLGPTFPSLRCRLDALRVQTETEGTLDALRVKLLAAIAKARARETQAEESCTAGRVKEPKVRLGQMRRQLVRYRRRLRMLAARHRELAAVAGPLADTALALRDDVRALRRALSCGEASGN